MEYHKISNLLGESADKPKRFQTRRWIEIAPVGGDGQYQTGDQIRIKTTPVMSSLCDYSEAYLVVKGTATVSGPVAGKQQHVAFKNCAPFESCISEINNTQVDNARDLDVVMPMYNLIEYSDNYAKTTGRLYKFSRDTGEDMGIDAVTPEVADADAARGERTVTPADIGFVAKNPVQTDAVNGTANMEIVVPLKYLSNFWRSLEMPLINTDITLILSWSADCLLATGTDNGADGDLGSRVKFALTSLKLHVPEVTLHSSDKEKFLSQLKTGFKRSVFWNEYLPKPTPHTDAQNNFEDMIEPSFQGTNRLFVLPFPSDNQVPNVARRYGRKYYMPNREITNYNVMINGKNFLDKPISTQEKRYEELRRLTIGQGDDYTTGCLLDYDYAVNKYKIIGIDLSKQQALDADPRAIQQINFTGDVPANTNIFYILEKAKETVLDFSQGMVKVM